MSIKSGRPTELEYKATPSAIAPQRQTGEHADTTPPRSARRDLAEVDRITSMRRPYAEALDAEQRWGAGTGRAPSPRAPTTRHVAGRGGTQPMTAWVGGRNQGRGASPDPTPDFHPGGQHLVRELDTARRPAAVDSLSPRLSLKLWAAESRLSFTVRLQLSTASRPANQRESRDTV